MDKIEQPELKDEMREHFDDEIQLIDYLRVIWKWKWLIILGTLVCMVVAGVVSFNMPKVYEVSMTIEPGIIGVDSDGKFIYLDSRDNIEGKIKGDLYNRRIQKALKINPLETDIKFEVRPQKGTSFIKVISEWEKNEVDFGKKALVNLLGFLLKEYENIVQQRKGDYEKQILMKQNEIKENEATLKIIQDREKELLQEKKNVKDNTEKIVRERNNVLQHKGNADDISLLLYSTTIQQNVAYFNELSNQMNDIKTKKEIASVKIENLKVEIDRLNLEKSIIKNIRVIQNPEASISPIKPKKRLNILLAGVIAFMMMMFLAFFVEYIRKAKSNNTIK